MARSSTTATLRPSLAAATAPFWPAGPLPMTSRSNEGIASIQASARRCKKCNGKPIIAAGTGELAGGGPAAGRGILAALKPHLFGRRMRMNKHAGRLLVAVAVALPVTLALAQTGNQQQPKMTPEQQAEMEAYMKAGTPGPQHQALAATAGSYTLKVKSWQDPTQP